MNYMKVYDSLVQKYQQNPPDDSREYCEFHHIIPKSFGGTDQQSNIVCLPVRCHIFAHMLLYKHWKDLAWKTMDDEIISKAGLMALTLDRLSNGTKFQIKAKLNFSSKLFANAKEDGHTTLRNMIWINNGHRNTMVDRRNPNAIPKGWKRGLVYKNKRKGTVWFNNGRHDIRIDPRDGIPSGFTRGRLGGKSALHMKWITNGHEDRYVERDFELPSGWRNGRISITGENSKVKRQAKKYEYLEKAYTIPELMKLTGYKRGSLVLLLEEGYTVEQLLEVPPSDQFRVCDHVRHYFEGKLEHKDGY